MTGSLKTRLLLSLMLPLSLAWILTLISGYLLTERTLGRQFDAQLERIARSLPTRQPDAEEQLEITEETELWEMAGGVEYQVWRHDKMVRFSSKAPREQLSPDEGYSQSDVGEKKWRVYAAQRGYARVVVGEDLQIRRSLIRGMIFSSLWPMAVAWPVIALLVWFGLGVALRPLARLSRAIEARSPRKLAPIEVGRVPVELAPVVTSLNALLALVEGAFRREIQFTENAAHELRTPLAGIKAQVEAARRGSEAERSEGLLAIDAGVERASRMIGQLLTLARLDPEGVSLKFEMVNISYLLKSVVGDLYSQAAAKKIELSLSEAPDEEIALRGDAGYLRILFSNLVDNAIRYSPRGGAVEIHLTREENRTVVNVRDNGPGVPAAERERVFERFVRLEESAAEGSGIGLAIVRRIAELHRIRLSLSEASPQGGLNVRIEFPPA